MVCVVTEGTESGFQRHVNPGSLTSPRGGGESQAETTSGGRKAGAEVAGGGVWGGGTQCTNAQSVGLT